MNKFLRLVENNLPDSTAKIPKDVLEDIKTLLEISKSKYSIEVNNLNSGIINIDNKPKFKITITPIVAEDAEDADIIGGGIKTSAKYGPTARVAADKLSQTAARRFNDVEKELASRKPKTNII